MVTATFPPGQQEIGRENIFAGGVFGKYPGFASSLLSLHHRCFALLLLSF
jgi:hypothetical protein